LAEIVEMASSPIETSNVLSSIKIEEPKLLITCDSICCAYIFVDIIAINNTNKGILRTDNKT